MNEENEFDKQVIKISLAKNITEVMAEFDFETTVEILKLMNIKWTRDGEDRYPTIIDVREQASDLMWRVVKGAYEEVSDSYFAECGCFRAEYHSENNDEWVDLMFEPCVWRKEC